MKNILLANIGNRNIKYNWDFIEKNDKSFYDFTKMLFEDIENENQNIQINILDSILNDYKINKIYLFATNQDPVIFHQDTFYEAKIIQYLLKNKYEVILVEKKDDPRNRENAFKFFEDFFENNKYLENENLIISWSWWIPAMKEALNFYSVIKFESSTILDVDETTLNIFKSDIQKEYLKNFDKKILIEMIQSYDYSWAYIFLKNSKLKNIELENYLLYCSNRYNFNLDKANQLLLNSFSSTIIKKIKLNNDLISKEVLFELFDNLEISYEKWEYASMLWKVYSLYENLIKYFYEDIYWYSVDDYEKLKKDWVDFTIINDYKNWVEFLKNEYEPEITYPKINSLKYKVQMNWKYWELFYWKKSFFKILSVLKDNRNNSIVAHWLEWVNNYISKDFYNLIKYIKDFFWIKTNIFHQINEELLKNLK